MRKRTRTRRTGGDGRPPTGRRGAGETAWLEAKRPVLRFVAVFALIMGLFHAVFFSRLGGGRLFDSYLELNAAVAGMVLGGCGYDVDVRANVISGEGAALSIARGCDALQPISLFVGAALAMPALWFDKLLGVAGGLAALVTLNIVRIVTLFYARLHHPKAFDYLHYDVWQAVFIVAAIALWVVWARWAVGRRGVKSGASSQTA